MILAALWFSEQKPTISTLLGPLMEEMNDLHVNGIAVTCGIFLLVACLEISVLNIIVHN